MTDHFVDHEPDEFFAKVRVKVGFFRQAAQAGNLAFLATGIAGGQLPFRLVCAHGLGDAEAFGKHVDQRRIDIVDAGAEAGKNGIGGEVGFAFGHRIVR